MTLSCNPVVQSGLLQNAAVFYFAILAHKGMPFWVPCGSGADIAPGKILKYFEKGKIREHKNNSGVK